MKAQSQKEYVFMSRNTQTDGLYFCDEFALRSLLLALPFSIKILLKNVFY